MTTKLPTIAVVTSAVLFAAVLSTTMTLSAFAQAFDITTEQADEEAVITVKLATNNTVVIPSNGTIIEVPGNVTAIDNDTVIVTPSNDTITEIPGNVTVISPPEPVPCECPAEEEPSTEPAGPIEPVLVTPAPGQEVITSNGTQLVPNDTQTEPIPIPEEPIEPTEPVVDDNTTGTNGNVTTEPAEPFPPVEEPVGNDTAEEPSIEPAPEEDPTNDSNADATVANFLTNFLGISSSS